VRPPEGPKGREKAVLWILNTGAQWHNTRFMIVWRDELNPTDEEDLAVKKLEDDIEALIGELVDNVGVVDPDFMPATLANRRLYGCVHRGHRIRFHYRSQRKVIYHGRESQKDGRGFFN
jgi:hypothetical protein